MKLRSHGEIEILFIIMPPPPACLHFTRYHPRSCVIMRMVALSVYNTITFESPDVFIFGMRVHL